MGGLQAAEERPTTYNYTAEGNTQGNTTPAPPGATPFESGGELFNDSPPQMRRGGGPSVAVAPTCKGTIPLRARSLVAPLPLSPNPA